MLLGGRSDMARDELTEIPSFAARRDEAVD